MRIYEKVTRLECETTPSVKKSIFRLRQQPKLSFLNLIVFAYVDADDRPMVLSFNVTLAHL